MPDRVYIETSVIGYLTSEPSRDLIVAAHQQITREWWTLHRPHFNLVSSILVRREVAAGNPEEAAKRIAVLDSIDLLDITDDATALAAALLSVGPLPEKADADALHIATAAVHGVDFLLTWNCRHIANAAFRPHIERICAEAGIRAPILSTPEELFSA